MHHPGFHPPLDGWLAGGLIAIALAAIARLAWRRAQSGGDAA